MARSLTLREQAVGFLARREHSREELRRRLLPRAESEQELDALLDELARRGKLSDARYAEARAHTLSRKYGSERIRRELAAKGVSASVSEAAIAEARAGDFDRAWAAWQRKFGTPPADMREKGRQARFLMSRGFGMGIIDQVLRAARRAAEEADPAVTDGDADGHG